MKKRLQYQSIKQLTTAVFITLLGLSTAACGEKIKKVDPLDIESTPTEEAKDLRLVYSEDGLLKNEITAPVAYRYNHNGQSYFLFPKGGMVRFYNEVGELESTMVADSAVYRQEPVEIMEGYANVVVRNLPKNQQLETDTLYWDQQQQKIYTYNSKVRISTPTDTLNAYWLEADENFYNYEFRTVRDSPTTVELKNKNDSTQTNNNNNTILTDEPKPAPAEKPKAEEPTEIPVLRNRPGDVKIIPTN